jgi:hypothetical protein
MGFESTSGVHLDLLVQAASRSLQELDIGKLSSISFDVLYSLQLMTLKIGGDLQLSMEQWRLLLNHLAPTLKYLNVGGEFIRHIDPPLMLPHLQTLLVQGSQHFAYMNLQAPQASRICFTESSKLLGFQLNAAGLNFARVINHRCRKANFSRPLRLHYTKDRHIRMWNPELEFCFNGVGDMILALSLLCRSLNAHIRESLTLLELNYRSTSYNYMDHAFFYRNIAEFFPNIQSLWLDTVATEDFIPWFTRPENGAFFLGLGTLKLVGLTNEASMNTVLVKVMKSCAQRGHPILLIVHVMNMNMGVMLHERGHDVTLVDD